jgi:hypothetical protein
MLSDFESPTKAKNLFGNLHPFLCMEPSEKNGRNSGIAIPTILFPPLEYR